ncbi:MAG: alpha/beta hydrolase [Hyphomicrobiales bacterium]|nr:MAG: alpha/beta hydrolase [Hyphomicrobiales bacterium]
MTERRPFTWKSNDGLSIAAADYPAISGDALPLVCLPGLTRSARDFEALARRISQGPIAPRRVFAISFRGRGASDYDPDWNHYSPLVEMEDVRIGLEAAGIERCHILGTSRGGMVATMLASGNPGRVASLIFNDIGPVIEARGLEFIRDYMGKPVVPASWDEAAATLKERHSARFTALSDADWMHFARQTYRDENGAPALDFDENLGRTMDGVDFGKDLPDLWPVYDALPAIPILVIRGENSNILSEKTVAEMIARRPTTELMTVANEGHAPLLWKTEEADHIAEFLQRADERAATAGTA